MIRISFLTVVTILALAFAACEAENVDRATDSSSNTLSSRQKNELLAQTISNLSEGLLHPEVREAVKVEALKRFDGTEAILLAASDQVQVPGSHSSNTLQDVIDNSYTFSSRDAHSSTIDSLKSFIPLAQLSVYTPEGTSLRDWDSSKRPIVAYVPYGEGDESLVGISGEGESVELSRNQAPSEVVFVVHESERVTELTQKDISGSKCSDINNIEPVAQTDDGSLVLKTDLANANNSCVINRIGPNGPTGPVGPIVGPTGPTGPTDDDCERDENSDKEVLQKFKFASEGAYKDAKDGWFNNDLEIQVDVVFSKANGSIGSVRKYFSVKQKDVKKLDWKELEFEIVTWTKDDYGNAMGYTWHEDDGGGTTEQSVKFGTKDENNNTTEVNTKVTVSNDGYDLGLSVVEYCDPYGREYNTGGVRFTVEHE